MKALALLGVFIIAKLLILTGRPVQLSPWAPIAYFWQDVLVALSFGLLDRVVGRAWFGWTLYGLAVAYVTVNVPITRLLSSPLTRSMLEAAGRALSDSIRRHVTPANLALMLLVAGSAVLIPVVLRRLDLKPRGAVVVSALMIVAIGPLATSRIETDGLGRNAIMTLASSTLPRMSARAAADEAAIDWRASPVDGRATLEDLSSLAGRAAGRNVVMIVLESAGAEYLLPYGASRDPMPNLSELARQAIVFENAYAVYPESIKEFFSVLCSRYPAMDTDSESYANIATPTLASELRREGYGTALFHSGRFMYLGMYAVVADRGYNVLEDAGAIGGDRQSSFGVDDNTTVRRALEWIDSLPRDQRFFLTYLPIAGHHPYDSPEPGPFPEQTESDRYLNALHYADTALGALIEGLRVRGLSDQTLLVIFGDHGQAFGQHEGNYGHSLFLYEENVRVPYLIVAPGLITAERRVSRPISLIDTTPTILDLIGSSLPSEFQGSSVLGPDVRMQLFSTDYSLSLMGLRDGCWKYIYEMDSGRSKLFNLCEDVTESNDMSSTNGDRVAAYRQRVLRWSSAQKAFMKGSR